MSNTINIKTIKLEPYYGNQIENYVNQYIRSAKKLSEKHKFSPNIYSIGFTPFNLRDDDRFNNEEEIYYSEVEEVDNLMEDTGFDSDHIISESSDEEDEFILVE